MAMTDYTVVGLHPDPVDCIEFVHWVTVEADPGGAARTEMAEIHNLEPEDFRVLAIFKGHHENALLCSIEFVGA